MGRKLPGAKIRPVKINPRLARGAVKSSRRYVKMEDSGIAKIAEGIALNARGKCKKRR